MSYKLEKAGNGWYVATDLENLVSVKFKEHDYQHTQKVWVHPDSYLSECVELQPTDLPAILRNIASWVHDNYHYIALPKKNYTMKVGRKNITIERVKSPRLTLTMENTGNVLKLAGILKNLGMFLRHNEGTISENIKNHD
jgi:hypothetical protein